MSAPRKMLGSEEPQSRWTPATISYFMLYATFGTALSLFVKASLNENGKFPYQPVIVTLMIESTKFVLALLYIAFRKDGLSGPVERIGVVVSHVHLAKYLAVPAAFYCVYNALAIVNLELVEPATYRVMITSKVLYSGIFLQYFFSTKLSSRQWYALVLLFLACVVEQIGSFKLDTGLLALALLSVQALCSAMAGTYLQFLLQRKGVTQTVDLWIKNAYLYGCSIVINLAFVILFDPDALRTFPGISELSQPVILTVLCAAFGGFTTSLILRYLDAIIKEYANFVEMITTMLFANWAFGTPMGMSLIVSILMVSVSLYMYNIKPEEDAGLLQAVGLGGVRRTRGGLDTLRSLSADIESDRLKHLEAGVPMAMLPAGAKAAED